jgi:hypothetical protein
MSSRSSFLGLLVVAFTISLPPTVAAQIYLCVGDECGTYRDLALRPNYVEACWEVTAQIGKRVDSRLAFTVRVVKIGNGPTGSSAYDIARRAS